jgi:hypothetical protein
LDAAAVYLVPIGSGRFELYTEPAEDSAPGAAPHPQDSYWRRTVHRLHERWRHAAHAAAQATRGGETGGRVARARDWLVRRIAESIAEQRTLWSLRAVTAATFVYPSDLSDASASAVRERLLAHARRHHGRWLLINAAGVAVTAVLVLLPGPNVIGYYFLFRVVGHILSWRGARQGLDRISWRGSVEPALTALGALAPLPRDERAERVSAIADRLRLPRLAAFFDRVAVPAR